MSYTLQTAFQKLNEVEKKRLFSLYKNSPLALKLFQCLNEKTDTIINSRKLIFLLYGEEKDNKEYKVFENRYHKIKKKILDDINDIILPSTESSFEEEEELEKCRILLSEGNNINLVKRLEKLENVCWEKNIFELLPAVFDLTASCLQSSLDFKTNSNIYKKWSKAINLNKDLEDAKRISRELYGFYKNNNEKNLKHALKKLKYITLKNKKRPRFEMIYHFVCLNIKSFDSSANSRAIKRHFNRLNYLIEKNRDMPIRSCRKISKKNQILDFYNISIGIYSKELNFYAANKIAIKTFDFIFDNQEIEHAGKYNLLSIAHFNNWIMLSIITGDFKQAKKFIAKYTYVVKHGFLNGIDGFDKLMILYCSIYEYGQIGTNDINSLNNLIKTKNTAQIFTIIPINSLRLLILQACLLRQEYKKSLNYIESLKDKPDIYSLYKTTIETFISNSFNYDKQKEILNMVKKEEMHNNEVRYAFTLKWLRNFILKYQEIKK